MRTADGHEARIYHQYNPWLIWKNIYAIEIMSKVYYFGYRRVTIYGWTINSLEEAKQHVARWTADEIFRVNSYLRDHATPPGPPP